MDGSLDAGEKYPREALTADDAVFQTDVKDTSEVRLLEPLQQFDIPTILCQCLATMQNCGEDYDKKDHDDAVITDLLQWERLRYIVHATTGKHL